MVTADDTILPIINPRNSNMFFIQSNSIFLLLIRIEYTDLQINIINANIPMIIRILTAIFASLKSIPFRCVGPVFIPQRYNISVFTDAKKLDSLKVSLTFELPVPSGINDFKAINLI